MSGLPVVAEIDGSLAVGTVRTARAGHKEESTGSRGEPARDRRRWLETDRGHGL